jgi:hypothetical protein
VYESEVVRFLGWNGIGRLSQRYSTGIRFASTELPLSQICAQEVFASFIRALFSVVDRIGGTNEVKGAILIPKEFHREFEPLELENSEISKVLEAFTNSNLGSRQDALFTTLPAIGAPKLRSLELVAESSRSQAKSLRREESWEEAMLLLGRTLYWVRELDQKEGRTMDAISTLTVALLETQRMHSYLRGDTGKEEFQRELYAAKEDDDRDHCHPILEYYYEAVSKGPISPFDLTGNLQQDLSWLGHPNAKLSKERLTENLFLAAAMEWHIPNASFAGRLKEEVSRAIIDMLLELGADPNHKDGTSGRTPLSIAAETGRGQAVALLLEAGANINDRDKEGKSALHYASIKGHVEVVKRLLQDKDIHINASDEQSCTALIYAAAHKHTRVIELIVDSGEWGGIGAELNVFALTGLNSVDGSTRDEVVRCILDRLNWRLDWDVEQEFSSASSDEQ